MDFDLRHCGGRRDRDDGSERNRGGGGGTSGYDHERVAQHALAKDLVLPDGRERRPVAARDRVYEINGVESRTLATIGAFRVVAEGDLNDPRGERHGSRETLKHLEREGLIQTAPLNSDDRAVTLTVRS